MAKDKVVVEIVAKDKTKKGVDSATKSFAKMAKTIGPLVAAGFGIAAVKSATQAFIVQENAVAQLEARLKSTGNAVGITSEGFQRMAAQLQKVTTFGDEAILGMQGVLLTFTEIGGKAIPQATEAILNVATVMETDLKSAALQVGKALNDPVLGMTALSRSGIQFTEDQKEVVKGLVEMGDIAGAQTIILAELEVQFGGAARAARDTLGGAIKVTEGQIGDLAEVFGAIFAPSIRDVTRDIGNLANRLAELISPSDIGNLEAFTSRLSDLRDKMLAREKSGFLAGLYGSKEEMEAEAAELEKKIEEINAKFEAQTNIDEAKTQAGIEARAGEELAAAQQSNFEQTQAAQMLIDAARIASAEETAAVLLSIEERAAEDAQVIVDQKAAYEQNARDTGIKALGDLASLMNSESKKAFEIGKVAAIAQATIATYTSATESYKALAGIPVVGPALGAAAAAAAVVAGLSNVQKISSTKFGGGGPSGAAVPNITTGGQVVGPVIQPTTQGAQTLAQEPIRIEGNSLLAVLVEEQLIPALNDAASRGVQLVIV